MAEFIRKKRTRVAQLFIVIIFISISLKSNAQRCADTVHIKGYYVVKLRKDEVVNPSVVKKDTNTKIVQFNVDAHRDESFIPIDSITQKMPLSYRLNHFFDDTKQVFISCEKVGLKDFVSKNCLSKSASIQNNSCQFPNLHSNFLYVTNNLNTGDVFEIYYIDAYWAKVKVRKGSAESMIIPGKIAQMCISPKVAEFDLYCFIRCLDIQMHPLINDPNIVVLGKSPN